jgi:putative phosphoribosyl transferase
MALVALFRGELLVSRTRSIEAGIDHAADGLSAICQWLLPRRRTWRSSKTNLWNAVPFKDRTDAGRKLAAALAQYKDQQPVVLALPRGGVPVAAEVAAPLDLILVRKIGVPIQPELAMGAVVDGGAAIIVRNEGIIQLAGVDEAKFKAICDSELAEIERRRQRYLGSRERVDVSGHTAIVIDDGVATGATTCAALRATRTRNPKKLVLAVPVAPTENLAGLRSEADEVICLEDHEFFVAIGAYYEDFDQVADEEVVSLLKRFPVQKLTAAKQPAA